MRRLIECRLVTDRFRESQLEVHEVQARANVEWRETFSSDEGKGGLMRQVDDGIRRWMAKGSEERGPLRGRYRSRLAVVVLWVAGAKCFT